MRGGGQTTDRRTTSRLKARMPITGMALQPRLDSAGMQGICSELVAMRQRMSETKQTKHEHGCRRRTSRSVRTECSTSQCSRYLPNIPFCSRSPEASYRLLGCSAGSADVYGIALTRVTVP